MLRKLRIAVALVSVTLVTLLFLDFSGTLHRWLGWLAKIQFLPALLAMNAGVVISLILLTLLFGRIYCSVICPLGIMQDMFGWMGKKRKKNRYAYSPARNMLRYTMLVLMVAAVVAGVGAFVAARSLQCLRAHRPEPVGSGVAVGQQYACPVGRSPRQLCVLFGRCMAQGHRHPRCGCSYDCGIGYTGLAQRAHVLQYDLSGRNCAGIFFTIFGTAAGYRHVEVQRLRAVCA